MASDPKPADRRPTASETAAASPPSPALSPEELAEKALQEELLDLFEEEMRGRPDCEGA